MTNLLTLCRFSHQPLYVSNLFVWDFFAHVHAFAPKQSVSEKVRDVAKWGWDEISQRAVKLLRGRSLLARSALHR